MANDVEHLICVCLSAIHISSLVKCPLMSFAQFLIELFHFLLLSFESSLYILDESFFRYVVCKYFFLVIYFNAQLSSLTFKIKISFTHLTDCLLDPAMCWALV